MRRRARTIIVAGVLLALGGAVGAYALDASKAGKIADGVRSGKVELGGLEADEAKRLLRDRLIDPLDRPIRVDVEGQTFVLAPEKLNVRAPIPEIVAEAEAVSREDDLPSRLWRYVTGGEVDHTIKPRVSFSKASVDEFVDQIAAAVNRPAQDATISPTPTSLRPVAGERGSALRAEQLRDDVLEAVAKPGAPTTIEASVQTVEPELTRSELQTSYPTYITIDRETFELRLFENLKLVKTYTIAVGQQGYDTPPGLYAIESKQVNPTWYVPEAEWAGDLAGEVVPPGPDNPLKARWMGFLGGAGIHGTSDLASLGGAASHGCVRMAIPDVVELYERVVVGTPVYIE